MNWRVWFKCKSCWRCSQMYTPKTNMSPRKGLFQQEYIFQPLIFRGHVSFQGSINICTRSKVWFFTHDLCFTSDVENPFQADARWLPWGFLLVDDGLMGVFFVWIFVGALNGSIHFLNRTIFWGYFRKHGFKKKLYSIFYSSVFNLQVSVTEINVKYRSVSWISLTYAATGDENDDIPNKRTECYMKLIETETSDRCLMSWLGFVVGCVF